MAEDCPSAGPGAAKNTANTTTPAPRERTTLSLNRGQVVLLANFIENAPAAMQDMDWDDATNTSGYHSVEHARAAFKRLKKRILVAHKGMAPSKDIKTDETDEEGPPPGKKAKLVDAEPPQDDEKIEIKAEASGDDEEDDLADDSKKKKNPRGKKGKAAAAKAAAPKPAKKINLDGPRRKIPVYNTNSPDPDLNEVELFSVKGPTAAATKKMAAKLKSEAAAKNKASAGNKQSTAQIPAKRVPNSQKNTSADDFSDAGEPAVATRQKKKPVWRELTHTPSRTPSPGAYGRNNFDPDKDSDADLTENTPNPPTPPPAKRTRKAGGKKRIDISELIENPLDEPAADTSANKEESCKASSSGKKGRATTASGKKIPLTGPNSLYGGKKLPSSSPPAPAGNRPPAGKTPALAPRFSTEQVRKPTPIYEEDILDYGEDSEEDNADDKADQDTDNTAGEAEN